MLIELKADDEILYTWDTESRPGLTKKEKRELIVTVLMAKLTTHLVTNLK